MRTFMMEEYMMNDKTCMMEECTMNSKKYIFIIKIYIYSHHIIRSIEIVCVIYFAQNIPILGGGDGKHQLFKSYIVVPPLKPHVYCQMNMSGSFITNQIL